MQHGTVNTYVNHNCRCTPCNEAHTTYGRNRRRSIAYGRHDPLADATQAQLHIKQLRADGMSIPHIAKRAGLPPHVIDSVQRGGNTKASKIAAILAVQATPTRLNHHLAIGPRRRIQGLQLLGWTIPQIAAAAGVIEGTIRHVTESSYYSVAAPTRDAVLKATRVLAARTPPDDVFARRCRTHARNRGYVPLMEWDDIDDPTEQPDTQPARTRHAVDPELVACVWRLREQGWTDQAIADEVGYRTTSAVSKLRQRHPNPQED